MSPQPSVTTAAELQKQLDELLARYRAEQAAAPTESAVRVVNARYLGKEGEIRRRVAEALKAAPGPEKRNIGQVGNAVITQAEQLFQERLHALHEAARQADLARRVDVTLPGRSRRLGALHLLTQVRRELEGIFAEIGFSVATGPQVETDFHNFEALAMPKDHPARDMQDTFYLKSALQDAGNAEVAPLVLRTHTSPVQIRTMLAQKPPVRIIAPGKVYRKDDDPTHAPMFQQIEGLCVDQGVTFADLKGTLLYFVQRFFGRDVGLRLRPSFFPFTEPSAEVDIECFFCQRSGCRTCKGTGYIEILGCGMVDPEVFRHVGYDAEKYSGFAFGTGLERMAILRYGLPDLRLFFSGDVRLTQQFR
jgi:phenylalanyl-tRNA synthetase alpha chain